MTQHEPQLRNDLKRRLPATRAGQLDSDYFKLLPSEVFMSVKDSGCGIANCPDGGILEDLRWTLQKMGGGLGIAPEPDTVTQLAQMAAAEKTR